MENNKKAIMNNDIRAPRVMLIGLTGKSAGVVETTLALQLANDEGLDLVQVNDGNPPVAKLMNYGKFLYEEQKARRKQAKEAASREEVKEIRLGVNTEEHDLMVKAKQASKFIGNGNKVRLTVMMKGRQKNRPESAVEMINKFADYIENSQLGAIKNTGRSVSAMLTPKHVDNKDTAKVKSKLNKNQ